MSKSILEIALEYEKLGLCVIPMKAREKSPALATWKQFQEQRSTTNQIQRWFKTGERNVGIVLGEVSSGVIVRDFDTIESYNQWANDFTDLAHKLPTVQTVRGRHVYARIDLPAFRSRSNAMILALGDGELRTMGLVVAPPSIHPSGVEYRWLTPLTEMPPLIDVTMSGFVPCNIEDREYRELRENRDTQITEIPKIQRTLGRRGVVAPFTKDDLSPEVLNQIQAVIRETVPKSRGKRHVLVFRLARALKAIPAIHDSPARQLEHIVRKWWELSKEHSQTPWEEHWADFLESWDKVKYPLGKEPMAIILKRAQESETPEVARPFEQEPLRLLVSLCRELQREAGAGPFFLSSRTAGRLLGVDHTTAYRWLMFLKNLSILELVEVGSQNPADRRASRYRYVEPL